MIRALLSIIGRVSIAAIFFLSAVGNKIPQFNDVVAVMEKEGVPNAKIALVGAIAFLIIGGLSLVLGIGARFGAFLLAVFLGAATYYFHDFWKIEDAAARQLEMGNFMKNLAIFGALLFIIANGGGAGCFHFRRPPPSVE